MTSQEWYSQSQSKEINELKVTFRREGSGPPLCCIHGFPSSSWDFEKLWPALTDRFDMIAHDLIGLGKSAKPPGKLTVALQADIIEELLENEGISEAHILAHDLGDTVAQEILARQFEGSTKIKWLSCVFLNGGLFPETHYPLLIQKLLMSPIGPLIGKLTSKKKFSKSMANVFSDAHPPSNDFIDDTWELICENKGKRMIPKLIHYMAERKKFRERWVKPMVAGIVPMRLINGVEDPISGRHLADRYKEIIPNPDVVYLENSGHYPHVETPERVKEAFLKFHKDLTQ